MSSNVPIVRQIARISAIPHLAVFGLIMYILYIWLQLDILYTYSLTLLTYIVISYCLKFLISGKLRKGIKLIKREGYLEAINCFEKSYDFFKRYNWVDKYRYITLLSSSRMSYKEIALNNIAFCYSQMGDGAKAKEWYERTLEEFPGSGMAIAALKFIDSVCK